MGAALVPVVDRCFLLKYFCKLEGVQGAQMLLKNRIKCLN